MNERMVVIRSFASEFDAHLAQAELTAARIPVRILSDGTSGVHPHLQFARGVRIAVPESRQEEAIEVLDTPAAAEEE